MGWRGLCALLINNIYHFTVTKTHVLFNAIQCHSFTQSMSMLIQCHALSQCHSMPIHSINAISFMHLPTSPPKIQSPQKFNHPPKIMQSPHLKKILILLMQNSYRKKEINERLLRILRKMDGVVSGEMEDGIVELRREIEGVREEIEGRKDEFDMML